MVLSWHLYPVRKGLGKVRPVWPFPLVRQSNVLLCSLWESPKDSWKLTPFFGILLSGLDFWFCASPYCCHGSNAFRSIFRCVQRSRTITSLSMQCVNHFSASLFIDSRGTFFWSAGIVRASYDKKKFMLSRAEKSNHPTNTKVVILLISSSSQLLVKPMRSLSPQYLFLVFLYSTVQLS